MAARLTTNPSRRFFFLIPTVTSSMVSVGPAAVDGEPNRNEHEHITYATVDDDSIHLSMTSMVSLQHILSKPFLRSGIPINITGTKRTKIYADGIKPLLPILTTCPIPTTSNVMLTCTG